MPICDLSVQSVDGRYSSKGDEERLVEAIDRPFVEEIPGAANMSGILESIGECLEFVRFLW